MLKVLSPQDKILAPQDRKFDRRQDILDERCCPVRRDDLDPISHFLLDTLVSRPTLLSRGGAPFVAIRRWRSGMKPYQIEAMRQIKRDPPARFVSAVVDDMLSVVLSMLGGGIYRYVAPIPCSRSGRHSCLSLLIAEKLSARLGMTLIEPLEIEPATGSSHPKTNLSRPPMTLLRPPPGPTLLVDDVVTSGAHMEEGTRLLLPSAQAVFALAWIGGGQSGS
jgi:hypothetical protein